MSVYIVNYSDPTKTAITVSTATVNTSTGMFLVGKNAIGYGELVAENFLHLLENFASPSMPSSPVEGQLWYDTSDTSSKILKVNTGAGNSWKPVNNTFVQDTSPSSPAYGDFWVDTTPELWNLNVYQPSGWKTVGPGITSISVSTATITSNLSVNGTSNISGTTNISGTKNLFDTTNISGAANLSGTTVISGPTNISATVTVKDVLPILDDFYSLGTNSLQFKDIYGKEVYGNFNSTSDKRDKTQIRDTVLGLSFINALRPVDFKWDYRSDYRQLVEETSVKTVQEIDEFTGKITSKQVETSTIKVIEQPKDGTKTRPGYHHGFIAQELKEVSDKLRLEFGGYKIDESGSFTVAYSELIAPIIKSIQELSKEVKRLSSIVDNQIGKI